MSTKRFLGGLGQGMMQLSATYGQTGLANLEAEAQRMKEERLATMQMAQFSLQSSKDLAQMEMGEKKFALLQDEDLRRQEELELKKQKQQYEQDLPDYEKVEKDVYKPIYDPVTKVLTDYEKADEEIYFINKKNDKVYQLKDGRFIEADPNTKIGKDEEKDDPILDPDADPKEPVELTQDEYINWWIARQQRTNPGYTMSHDEKVKFIKDYFSKYNKPFKEGGTVYFKQPESKIETNELPAEIKPIVHPDSDDTAINAPADVIVENGIITEQKGWTEIEKNAMREQVNNDTEFLTALEAELGEDVANEVWNARIEDEVLRRLRGETEKQGIIKQEVKKDETIEKKEETNILKMEYDQAIKVIRDTIKRMEDQKMTKTQIIDALFRVVEASATSKEFTESKYAKALNDVIIELGSK